MTDELVPSVSTFEAGFVRDGRVRRTGFSLAQPTAAQLVGMLREAGFEDVRAFDETGGEFTTRSRRLLVLASVLAEA